MKMRFLQEENALLKARLAATEYGSLDCKDVACPCSSHKYDSTKSLTPEEIRELDVWIHNNMEIGRVRANLYRSLRELVLLRRATEVNRVV